MTSKTTSGDAYSRKTKPLQQCCSPLPAWVQTITGNFTVFKMFSCERTNEQISCSRIRQYVSFEISALLWRRNVECPRTHIGDYKGLHSLYFGKRCKCCLKIFFVLVKIQSTIQLIVADIHFVCIIELFQFQASFEMKRNGYILPRFKVFSFECSILRT